MQTNQIHPSVFLYDVPPSIMDTFSKIMDSGVDMLGWRTLAARILPNLLEVRCIERLAVTGKSPTLELMWSWAQQNKTVGDLLKVLEDMGHHRALSLFQPQGDSYYEEKKSEDQKSPSYPEFWKTQSTSRDGQQNKSRPSEVTEETASITYSEIIEGSRNFHHDLKIGEGTFSEVYKVTKGNETFAVKLFKQTNKATWKTLWDKFRAEIEVLNLYRHDNILALRGCFSEGDRFCLVYQYMPNGSLYHRLHQEDVGRALSWQERVDVIKGTARAVHYLHTAQPCTVLCGNISSSNILLDENLQAKLIDFGMARLRPHSVSQSFTIIMDTVSRGNLAYLPEEYIRDGKLSTKTDIYSFGVVILETCTGQEAMLQTTSATLLREVLNAEVRETGGVDACLRFLDRKAGPCPHADVLCLFRLGLECSAGKAKGRPSMDTVLQTLSKLLPLPLPPDESPRSLDDHAPPQVGYAMGLAPSLPEEDHDTYGPLEEGKPVGGQSHVSGGSPCECSQSEVTFLGNREKEGQASGHYVPDGSEVVTSDPNLEPDLYSSWPVECSCEVGSNGPMCEDCYANGFTQSAELESDVASEGTSQPPQSIPENPAKERLRKKIQLYNRGLLSTVELLSITSD